MKIIVQHHPAPIPDRSFDYSAFDANYESGDPIGYGATPEDAKAELLEQMEGWSV